MAPQTPIAAAASNSSDLEKSLLGCECAKVDVENNNNNNQTLPPPQHVAFSNKNKKVTVPNSHEANDRNRNLIGNCFKHLSTNLNVLVIGSNSSG